jgi:hypothetical protein
MTRLLVVSAVALAAITFSVPAPAQAQSKADGVRNVETTDFSARRRHWRYRRWGGYAFPFFAGAALAAAAAPRYYYGPRYYYPRYYRYRPAYYPYAYYPRYRYYRRPGVSISFGFGGHPYWW